jgi:hypothetical protein
MKAVLHYLLLVGMPVLGVFALLRAGERLTAPVSVGGTWNLEIDSQFVDSPACTTLSSQSEQPVLTISQSGPHLRLTFNDEGKTMLVGEIDDTTIVANAIRQPAAGDTRDNHAAVIHFEAIVNRQTEPDRLEGTLIMNDCRVSAPLTALRQPVSRVSGGGH